MAKSSYGQELVQEKDGTLELLICPESFWKFSKTFLENYPITLHQRQKCEPHCRAHSCSPALQTGNLMVAELAVDRVVGMWNGVDDSNSAHSLPDALLVAYTSHLISYLSRSFFRLSTIILSIQMKTFFLKFGGNLICQIRSHKGYVSNYVYGQAI